MVPDPDGAVHGGVPRHVIYLLRHAKSSWDEPELLDHERPLAKRGRKAVALLREHARKSGIAPDLVLCSSAARAIQTLEGYAKAFLRRPWSRSRLASMRRAPGRFWGACVGCPRSLAR